MKGSRSRGGAQSGKKSELKSVEVDDEPMHSGLKDVLDRHPRGLAERCPERRSDGLVNT